jgi:hypothetical protein
VPLSRIATVAFAALFMLLPACSRELAVQGTSKLAREPAEAGTPAVVHVASSASPVVSAASGVAVIELFTSEGCSSCPPADRALANLTARAKAQDLPVYTLSFHVDYWNYLGWRDPFSSASYSERQHGYSAINERGGTYTPQAVINGEAECVGSDVSRIGELVDAALKRPPRTQIDLRARRSGLAVDIDYTVSGATAGRVLNLAVLQPQARSQVEHGENAGERLAHVNVVRRFASRALGDANTGHWELPIGNELANQSLRIVAFAEDGSQRDISGATAVELP